MFLLVMQLIFRAAALCWEGVGGVSDLVHNARFESRRRGPLAASRRAAQTRHPRCAAEPDDTLALSSAGAATACLVADERDERGEHQQHPPFLGWPGPVLLVNATSLLGRECLTRLARSRWTVFAGVRTVAEGVELASREGEHVHPVLLELDDPESVELTMEELQRVTGSRRLAIVVTSDTDRVAPLERVFAAAPHHNGADGRCPAGAHEPLALLLSRADRLVFVSPRHTHRATSAALEEAVRGEARRRRAAGERDLDVSWLHSAGRRSAPWRVSGDVEATLRRAHSAQVRFTA
jgi:hypothetical protein